MVVVFVLVIIVAMVPVRVTVAGVYTPVGEVLRIDDGHGDAHGHHGHGDHEDEDHDHE